MRLIERPEKKRRVEVSGIDGLEIVGGAHVRDLVDVIGPRAAFIDLLKDDEIGIAVIDQARDILKVLLKAVFASCPGVFASVHEEAVIGRIGAKSDVICHDGISLIAGDDADPFRSYSVHGRIGGRIRLGGKDLVIGDPVVAGKDIDDVADDDQKESAEYAEHDPKRQTLLRQFFLFFLCFFFLHPIILRAKKSCSPLGSSFIFPSKNAPVKGVSSLVISPIATFLLSPW